MERNREARRTSMPAMNGLARRKHRTVLRDSPEEDVAAEMLESVRSRDRKKDRERERERLGRSKRRRNERLTHETNREDGSTEESANDDEVEDGNDDNDVARGVVRDLQSNHLPVPSHHQNQNRNNQLQSRKSFPPASTSASKVLRPVQPWETGDQMIGVSVPRKARSASVKRSHDCWVSGAGNGSGVIGEQTLPQPSSSPARPSLILAASPSTISPSSSNISAWKKMKSNGSKHRPPIKVSSKSSSPNQDEIEIAEVLFGMTMQPQGQLKQDITAPNDSVKIDSRELIKTPSTGDAKSRVLSPIPQSSSSAAPPVAIAPKRKRPRPVNYNDEIPSFVAAKNIAVPSTSKVNLDQTEKTAISSSTLSQAVAEFPPESMKVEKKSSDSKKYNEELVNQEAVEVKEDEAQSTKASPGIRWDEKGETSSSTKEDKKEEKFQIDLMALPQNGSSSPEKDNDALIDTVESKPIDSNIIELEQKPEIKEEEKPEKWNKNDPQIAESELKKARVTMEEDESQRQIVNKERILDLRVDYAKSVRDGATGNKLLQPTQTLPKPKTGRDDPSMTEKTGLQSTGSLPLSTPMANWPGGLPPIGCMAPQGVVSMDGSSVSSTPLQFQNSIFSHPRPKKCATHNYIAKNIHLHQQFIKTNPFRQATATPGPASLYGLRACNLNAMPSSEVHGNFQVRDVNSTQDKAQGLTTFPGHVGKDKGSEAANSVDSDQRKQQIFLQQPLPAGVPNNILHGPAFIFPMSQPQAAVASSVRPGSSKNLPTASSVTSVSNSALASSAATGVAVETAVTAMSFNYPTIATNDTQYLAVLQNGSYPFPIPGHVGGAPVYRGTHSQAIPFFNGSFYSQMVYPSQLQQQPQQPPPPQIQHKHLQNLQHRPQSSGTEGGIGSLKSSPVAKYELVQQLNQQGPHQLESDKGGEDSPSTADSRVSRTNMTVYGQNFTLMTHPVLMGTTSNPSERKQQQQQPQPQGIGLKTAGGESLPSQAFAMSFSSINSSGGLDISLTAQNQAILQNFPEGARHGYHHIMAATHSSKVSQQKNSSHQRSSEEVKSGGNDSFNMEEERKSNMGKVQHTIGGQSIAFSRSDLTDTSNSTIPVSTGAGSSNTTSSTLQQQRQQQQVIQLQKQHAQYATATTKSKMPAGIGNVYSDQLPSSSLAAIKFSNSTPSFLQNLVQNSSGSSESPQWKSSVQPTSSQLPSPDMAATGSSTPSLKTAPQQQQNRTQQAHSQMSFTGNLKSLAQPPKISQGTAAPMMVSSSAPISLSKGASGSPGIATSNSTSNKSSQGSTLSPQYSKGGSPAVTQKSSPVGGRTVPPPSLGTKPQLTSQAAVQLSPKQQPNQLSKQAMQQVQLSFSNPYMQNQAPNSSSVVSTASGNAIYYAQTQRRRPEQQQQPINGSSATSTTGMLSLGSTVTLNSTNAAISDPVKAVSVLSTAAAVTSLKGDGLPSANPHQLMPPGFSYVQAVPTAVQLKVTEQKQPAGE